MLSLLERKISIQLKHNQKYITLLKEGTVN